MPQDIFDQIHAEEHGGSIKPPPLGQRGKPDIFDQIHAEEQQHKDEPPASASGSAPWFSPEKHPYLYIAGEGVKEGLAQGAAVLKGLPQAITGIPSGLAQTGSAAYSALTGDIKTAEDKLYAMGKGLVQPYAPVTKTLVGMPPPPGAEWNEAAEGQGANLGGLLLTAAVPKVIKSIPSKARAVANLDTIMKVAKDIPLDLTEANNIIDRATEISNRGGPKLPKPMSDLAAAQNQGPVTFEAGKDFASNASSQSIEESMAVKGQMKAQVAQFAKALREANRVAADQVGMGDLYSKAIKEYARASTIADKAAVLQEYLVKAAIIATTGHLVYKIYSEK